MILRRLLIAALALAAGAAAAAEFRSVAEPAVVYDAPTLRGKKLYVAPRGMPVEVVVSIEGWQKVRDRAGDLMWIERKSLSDQRTLVVRAPVAQLREKPEDNAKVLLEAGTDVLFELLEPPANGWVKVRHRDGAQGYVRVGQVWGL
jgi:SH3-like domain-containing protein